MLLRHLPRHSATALAVEPEAAWGDTEHLLAAILNTLRDANWQRAGDKNRPRPEPVLPPSAQPRSTRSALTPEEMHARLVDLQRRRRAANHRKEVT